MTSAQRILVAALAVLAATSTTAAIWLATRPPPPVKVYQDEPYLPVSPGTPNSLGELVAARGGPAVPKVPPTLSLTVWTCLQHFFGTFSNNFW